MVYGLVNLSNPYSFIFRSRPIELHIIIGSLDVWLYWSSRSHCSLHESAVWRPYFFVLFLLRLDGKSPKKKRPLWASGSKTGFLLGTVWVIVLSGVLSSVLTSALSRVFQNGKGTLSTIIRWWPIKIERKRQTPKSSKKNMLQFLGFFLSSLLARYIWLYSKSYISLNLGIEAGNEKVLIYL